MREDDPERRAQSRKQTEALSEASALKLRDVVTRNRAERKVSGGCSADEKEERMMRGRQWRFE